MKTILGLIFNRWTMGILGIVAVSLIIWFAGPLLAFADYRPFESKTVRWVLIGLIVLFFVGRIIWRFLKAKLANKQLFEGLLKQAPAPAQANAPGAEEVATLNQRFEEAVGVLKQANLGSKDKKSGLSGLFGRQYVYQLPWYIFIGAPGSGKTTALINSGLKFPLAERFGEASIRGIGGTRNCDWWFTDEAVLLDTAGRYTTQESNQEADSAAWAGFLQLLKKFRPRRPINGVFLTISAADLLQQSPSEREVHIKALRKRIQELHEQLGIRFPLYVLITKADLLAGFMEFYGAFGAEERAQVWGVSLPLAEKPTEAAPLVNFGNEFSLLEKRLNERLVDRLQEERDVQRRALLYTLPQQFASLKDVLTDFLDKVFSPSRFEEKPLLRGVYFTSGTQEGSPIDRIMGSLGRAFRLERKMLAPMRPSGKSFFITRLIRDVIFPEAGLAGTNLRWERRRALFQWGGLAIACLITITGIFAWSVSYARNKSYVAEVETQLKDVAKQVEALTVNDSTDVVGLLPVLQSVQNLTSTSSAVAGDTPVSMTFGLYQGDKLASASDNAYHRLLHDAFLPRVAMRIEQQLRTIRDNPEALYETLKAYIMLNSAEQFDADALKVYIRYDWDNHLPREVTSEQRQALVAHLDALLAHGAVNSPIAADAQLIADVRNSLLRMPLAQRAYSRLKRLGVGADIPEFTISRAAGSAAPLVFARASGQPLTSGVPGLFTYDGYYKAFQNQYAQVTTQLADEEGWVLGVSEKDRGKLIDPKGTDGLVSDVRRLYLTEYANYWENFISDIRVVTGRTQGEAIQSVRILSAPDSPLPDLLRKIVREVTLVKKNDLEKTLIDKGEAKLKASAAPLSKLFGDKSVTPTTELVAQPESLVDDRFDNLRRMVTAPAQGQLAPIDGAVALLKEMYVQMQAAESALKGGNTPPPDTTSNKVKVEAGQMPEPLRSALITIATVAANQALVGMKGNLSDLLGSNVGDFCNKAISGRYPLVKSSPRDVTQDDFARLFGPAGLLDDFFQKNLVTLVDTSTKPWSYRQLSDKRMTDSTGALLQFQRAQTIRDVFFRGGGRAAGMRLDFKPVEMDASITQFILDVDGQIVKYSHGPQVPQPVQWPGPRGSSQVRVQLTPPATSAPFGPFEGPWALFRMFDKLKIDQTAQPEKFLVTFNIDGRKAQFEVVTSSVQNPFRLRDLEQFQCPSRL
jgi:type VI secretion system protein ImpL